MRPLTPTRQRNAQRVAGQQCQREQRSERPVPRQQRGDSVQRLRHYEALALVGEARIAHIVTGGGQRRRAARRSGGRERGSGGGEGDGGCESGAGEGVGRRAGRGQSRGSRVPRAIVTADTSYRASVRSFLARGRRHRQSDSDSRSLTHSRTGRSVRARSQAGRRYITREGVEVGVSAQHRSARQRHPNSRHCSALLCSPATVRRRGGRWDRQVARLPSVALVSSCRAALCCASRYRSSEPPRTVWLSAAGTNLEGSVGRHIDRLNSLNCSLQPAACSAPPVRFAVATSQPLVSLIHRLNATETRSALSRWGLSMCSAPRSLLSCRTALPHG